jgi:hypothetical protein
MMDLMVVADHREVVDQLVVLAPGHFHWKKCLLLLACVG